MIRGTPDGGTPDDGRLPLPLPDGVRSGMVDDVNGLTMHLLEAGTPGAPVILLLHGFPELAYSWRNVMPPLAEAGFHALAPDLRGYGRTEGWSGDYSAEIHPFGFANLVLDLVALLERRGIDRVRCLVGHDFGSPLAAWASLLRPELFERVVLMSAPFGGAPGTSADSSRIHVELLALEPPRKHYLRYNTEPDTNRHMVTCPEGIERFLRAYYHMKSADWPGNVPHALPGWSANALAMLPHYYVMPAGKTMPEAVAPEMPESLDCAWMPESALRVYASEFRRTGFQGGLNWYRCAASPELRAELAAHHGRKIPIPCWFIAGAADWGVYQSPGALERMRSHACADFRGVHLIERAGHWVQQEQPRATVDLIRSIASS